MYQLILLIAMEKAYPFRTSAALTHKLENAMPFARCSKDKTSTGYSAWMQSQQISEPSSTPSRIYLQGRDTHGINRAKYEYERKYGTSSSVVCFTACSISAGGCGYNGPCDSA